VGLIFQPNFDKVIDKLEVGWTLGLFGRKPQLTNFDKMMGKLEITMNVGLLWYEDPNQELTLFDKVNRAADRYQSRFGEEPNLCYVNPGMLNNGSDEPKESVRCNGVLVVAKSNVLKNHFWIGVGDGAKTSIAAN
jgi:hypothetical protein